MAEKVQTLTEVRCSDCGKRQPASNTSCGDCHHGLISLCMCGAEVGFAHPNCAACGRAILHPRYHPPSRKKRVALLVSVIVVVIGVPGAVGLWRSHKASNITPYMLNDQAAQLDLDGELELAQHKLEQALELDPQYAIAAYNLAGVKRRLGNADEEEILRLFKLAATSAQFEPRYGYAYARALVQSGDTVEARRWIQRVTNNVSAPPEAWALLAELELMSASPDYALALRALERARTPSTDSPALRARIAQVRLLLLGYTTPERMPADVVADLKQLEPLVGRDNEREDASPAAGLVYGELLFSLGNYPRAVDVVRDALARFTQDEDAMLKARLHALIGRCRYMQGRHNDAEVSFISAVSLSPSAAVAGDIAQFLSAHAGDDLAVQVLTEAARGGDPKGGVRAVLARLALVSGDRAEAERLVEEIAPLRGDIPDFHVLRGGVHRLGGRWKEAQASYAIAAAESGNAVAHARLALLALDAPGNTEERRDAIRAALADLEEAILRTGGGPVYDAAVGALQAALGNNRQAREFLEQAVEADPWSPRLWLQLAETWATSTDEGAMEKVATAYRKAVQLRPLDPTIVRQAARSSLAIGEAVEAVDVCSVLLGAHPGEVPVRRLRAEAYLRLADYQHAIEDLLELVKDDPAESDWAWLLDTYYRIDQREDAWAVYERIHEHFEGAIPARIQLVRARYDAAGVDTSPGSSDIFRAAQELLAGNMSDAIVTLRRLHADTPGDVLAARLLVLALLSRGNQAEPVADRSLIEEAQRVVAALPENTPRATRELLEGRVLLAEGKYHDALPRLRFASTHLPDDPYAQFYYGDALFFTGDRTRCVPALRRSTWLPGAIEGFRQAVSERLFVVSQQVQDRATREGLLHEVLHLDPDNLEATEELSRSLMRRGSHQDAARICERRLELGNLDERARRRMLYVALVGRMEAMQLDAAWRHLTELEKSPPFDDETDLGLAIRGMLRYRKGKLKEARELFEDALAADPHDRVACLGVMLVHAESRAFDAGRAQLDSWARLHPDDQQISISYTRMLTLRGHYAEAQKIGQMSIARWPGDPVALRQKVQAMWLQGQRSESIEEVRKALRNAPADERPRFEVLLAELLAKDPSYSRESLEIAARLIAAGGDDDRIARLARVSEAEALLSVGRYEEGIPRVEKLSQFWRDGRPADAIDRHVEARVRFVRGLVAFSKNRRAEAAREFQLCLQLDPANDGAANNLAWLLAKEPNSSEEAWNLAVSVTERVSDQPDYWDTRGYCALEAGRPDDAEKSWKRALELFDGAPLVDEARRARTAEHLATMLFERGRITEARSIARDSKDRIPAGMPTAWADRILDEDDG